MRKLLAAAIVAFGFGCGASGASTLTLTATPDGLYAAFYSGFSITFNDTGDNLLDPGEVTSFSGIVVAGTIWDRLSHVGTAAGFTDAPAGKDWQFKSTALPSAKLDVDPGYFTYAYTSGGTGNTNETCWSSCGGGGGYTVPEPTTWALMIAGFAGLGFSVRRARSAQSIWWRLRRRGVFAR